MVEPASGAVSSVNLKVLHHKTDRTVDRMVTSAREGRQAIDTLARAIDRAENEYRLYLYGYTRRRDPDRSRLDELPQLTARGLTAGDAAAVRQKRRFVVWV